MKNYFNYSNEVISYVNDTVNDKCDDLEVEYDPTEPYTTTIRSKNDSGNYLKVDFEDLNHQSSSVRFNFYIGDEHTKGESHPITTLTDMDVYMMIEGIIYV